MDSDRFLLHLFKIDARKLGRTDSAGLGILSESSPHSDGIFVLPINIMQFRFTQAWTG